MNSPASGYLPFRATLSGQHVGAQRGGARRLLESAAEPLSPRRVLVICSRRNRAVAERLTAGLPVVTIFDRVRVHVPREVADEVAEVARESGADLVVTVGGGSAVGTGKALALMARLPVIAVPTTFAGSEMTPIWGLTDNGRKTTGTDPRVLPRAVVYDPDLMAGLPVATAIASVMNALAHCFDSFWSPGRNPESSALASAAARALAGGLRSVVGDGEVSGAAAEALCVGAMLAGRAFAGAGSGLHHKICHVIGGAFDLPHAETHAAVLPWIVALNGPHSPQALETLAALGITGPGEGFQAFVSRAGAGHALGDLGVGRAELMSTIDSILAVTPPDNPAPVDRAVVADLLENSWRGIPSC